MIAHLMFVYTHIPNSPSTAVLVSTWWEYLNTSTNRPSALDIYGEQYAVPSLDIDISLSIYNRGRCTEYEYDLKHGRRYQNR
jgi:hypothetical protein